MLFIFCSTFTWKLFFVTWVEVWFFSVKYSQLSYYYLLKDGGAWWAAVHGVTKSWTRLSDFTITFHFHALEKEMATHSSVLAWRIPGMGEPGGLPSMGSHRVGHDWSDVAAEAACTSPLLSTVPIVLNYVSIYMSLLDTWIWSVGLFFLSFQQCHTMLTTVNFY